jgi:ABC-2 type transport system permease protein
MATLAATSPHTAKAASPGIWLPAYTLWQRELVRFYRQKARVVGVIASPLIFWVVLGAGFAHSFTTGGGSGRSAHYLGYFFPGSIAMIVLFTAIFSMMSLIQDRNEGFLLSVLAAPVSRSSIVLGKVLGGATLAAVQGIIFLVFGPLVGVHMTPSAIGLSTLAIVMIALNSPRWASPLPGPWIRHKPFTPS